MPYTGVQFAAARQQVSLRLADPGQIFWPDAEIGAYLVEALQVFSAFTGYWDDTGLVNLTPGSPWFTLANLQNGAGANPITWTADTVAILTQIQEHLLEPVSSNPTWAGTEMFSYAQIQAALQRRTDQFVIDTGVPVVESPLDVPAPGIYRFPLDALAGLVDLRRMAWVDDTTGYITVMVAGDEFEFNAYSPGWQQSPGTPLEYSILDVPALMVQVSPPPMANGWMDVLFTATKQFAALPGDDWIPVPADYAWAVKYGAMADLLNMEAEAKDAQRAAYCEQRYQMGVQTCRAAASVMQAYYLGAQVPLSTVREWDTWCPTWQNLPEGPPQSVASAGLNLFAVSPPPDQAYQIGVDVTASAPVPVLDTDYIQLGPEALEAVYGYAQHIAAFKQGGEEFQASIPLLENFIRVCGLFNAKLKNFSSMGTFLVDRQTRVEALRPRIEGAEVEAKQ